jgi:hypothetical protein
MSIGWKELLLWERSLSQVASAGQHLLPSLGLIHRGGAVRIIDGFCERFKSQAACDVAGIL